MSAPPTLGPRGALFDSHARWLRGLSFAATRWEEARAAVAQLQQRFDQEAEELAVALPQLRQQGEHEHLERLANSMMESHLELCDQLLHETTPAAPTRAMRAVLAQ